MIFKLTAGQFNVTQNRHGLSLRCPECRQLGTFEAVNDQVIYLTASPHTYLGHRRCPNHTCHAHVFVVWRSGKVIVSYPPERIDFDASSIPEAVLHSFEEALTCHANTAYVAAAIMVRRTLEDLCADQKAKGKDLKERIKVLGSKVVLPTGLLAGLDSLRLLGNDAAHVEANVYEKVGKEEVELAIDVTKEVLKAVYQLDSLVARLEKLKKSKEPQG